MKFNIIATKNFKPYINTIHAKRTITFKDIPFTFVIHRDIIGSNRNAWILSEYNTGTIAFRATLPISQLIKYAKNSDRMNADILTESIKYVKQRIIKLGLSEDGIINY